MLFALRIVGIEAPAIRQATKPVQADRSASSFANSMISGSSGSGEPLDSDCERARVELASEPRCLRERDGPLSGARSG